MGFLKKIFKKNKGKKGDPAVGPAATPAAAKAQAATLGMYLYVSARGNVFEIAACCLLSRLKLCCPLVRLIVLCVLDCNCGDS